MTYSIEYFNSHVPAEIKSVREALIEGENSGEPKLFDAEKFKQRMLALQNNRGRTTNTLPILKL